MARASGGRGARAAAAALHAAYNDHDAARAAALYAPDGMHEDVAQGRVADGPRAVRSGLERFLAAFPDARWEVESVTGDERLASAPYRVTGTLRARLGPFEPVGQRLDLRGVHVVEVDADGRIARTVDYWDGAGFARQMAAAGGVSPAGGRSLPAEGIPAMAPEGFRRAMRLLAGGVAVVTTVVDGRPWGLTVSACCSLTADPPQVLVSLDSRTASCRAIVANGRFGVDLLGSDQVDVARSCAVSGRPKFIEGLVDGSFAQARSPVIAEALAHLDCRLVDSHEVGDHRLLVGLVQGSVSPRTHDELTPLVYYEREFRSVGAVLR